jgi:hypothetical protein
MAYMLETTRGRKVGIDPRKAHATVKTRMAARMADPREQPAERELARRITACEAGELAALIEISGKISRGEMTAVQALAELEG